MIVNITLRKVRSTWHWFAHNEQGGGSGGTHAGSKKVALQRAALGVQPGQTFDVITEGRSEGQFTVDEAGKVVRA